MAGVEQQVGVGQQAVGQPPQPAATPAFDMSKAWGITPAATGNNSQNALNGLQNATPYTPPTAPIWQDTPQANSAAIENARKRQTMAQQVPKSAVGGLTNLSY
jgi:hypothetical protein